MGVRKGGVLCDGDAVHTGVNDSGMRVRESTSAVPFPRGGGASSHSSELFAIRLPCGVGEGKGRREEYSIQGFSRSPFFPPRATFVLNHHHHRLFLCLTHSHTPFCAHGPWPMGPLLHTLPTCAGFELPDSNSISGGRMCVALEPPSAACVPLV